MKQLRAIAGRTGLLLVLLTAAVVSVAEGQQVPDTDFRPPIEKPAFAAGKGPVVFIDEAHFNFHTASGRYLPFAQLLQRDGYVVKAFASRLTAEALKAGTVLVISNALNEKNQQEWDPPHLPAFAVDEIAALRDWVSDGGALLLIADHAPFAGAAKTLGEALGVRFLDGYALPSETRGPALVFKRSDGTLLDHPVTKGIEEVATFTGSSFQLDTPGHPLLQFGPAVFSSPTPNDPSRVPVTGHLQGAVFTLGKGRVAVFGEAAMFSAQLAGPNKMPMGMNAPAAKQNPQFLLNVMHWLTRLL